VPNLKASFAVDTERLKGFGIVDPRVIQTLDIFKSGQLTADERLYLGLWGSPLLSSIAFEPKRKILVAGEAIEQAYLIVSGTLLGTQGDDIYRFGPGSVLGLAEGVINQASKYNVITASAVQARVIPLHRIDSIVAKLPLEVRAILMTTIKRTLALQRSAPSELENSAASSFETLAFSDGQKIFSLGDPAEHLYFLQSGTVEMVDGKGSVFAEVSEGNTFGEAAILPGGIRGATVRAKGSVRCKLMGAQAACEMLHAHSPLLVTIVEALLLQLSMQNTLRQG
jgi:CRP-like cAMP-binding protein